MSVTFEFEFDAVVFEWRGPAPFVFVAVPEDVAEELHDLSTDVTYGWGMIPATIHVGTTTWTTSLWPRQGGYVIPLKVAVRRSESIDIDDVISVRLAVDLREPG